MRQKVTTKSVMHFGDMKSTTPIKSHSRQASYSKSKSMERVTKGKEAHQMRDVASQERPSESENQHRQINIDINNQKSDKEVQKISKGQERQKKDVMLFQKNLSEPDFMISESFKRKQGFIEEGIKTNKIKLIVRVRPFLITEQLKECLKVVNENGIRLFKEYHQIHFKFDNILLPKDNQECVFQQISSKHNSPQYLTKYHLDTVTNFMNGVNGTIFAYGQTGAGKTYSIIGGVFQEANIDKETTLLSQSQDLFQNEKKGILPRTLDSVFLQLSQLHGTNRNQFNSLNKSKLFISFYEIYNEKIFDLLTVSTSNNANNQSISMSIGNKKQFSMLKKEIIPSSSRDHLDLREEKDGYFSVVDLRKIECSTLQEAYQWLEKGLIRRQTSATSFNNNSSRSHSIFQIYLERVNEEGMIVRSKLRIVDLAGSEKYTLKKDLPAPEKSVKVQELTSINSSLSALGQCISALADLSRKHIPYRNSKLTRVLKDSLDENSNVAMIICISPSVDSYKETFSTLQFADRAKKAILDGRNFSDSKLLGGGEQFLQQYKLMMNGVQQEGGMHLDEIMKAYQEDKGVRKEMEKYMNQNYLQKEVFDELDRLKKHNQELQEKVNNLEQIKTQAPQTIPLKGCFKQKDSIAINTITKDQSKQNKSTIIMNIKDEDMSDGDESPLSKRVHFAHKLQNDESLDSETRERIEHNLKYNDDTIFDNISIFRDLNNSGIVLLPKKLEDKKDVHPSVLKRRSLLKEGRVDLKDLSEDEDEDEENRDSYIVAQLALAQENKMKLEQNNKEDVDCYINDGQYDNGDEIKEQSDIKEEGVLMEQTSSPKTMRDRLSSEKKIEQFWAVQTNDKYLNTNYQDEKMGVSPIQRKNKNNNNSSQDMSKDLIDLESENQLGRMFTGVAMKSQKGKEKGKGNRVGDKTMGAQNNKQKHNDFQAANMNHQMTDQLLSQRNEDELQQSIGMDDDEIKRNITLEQMEQDDDDDNMPKDYHVCDSSEQQFFDNGFNNTNQQDPEQILSDSIVMEMMIVEEAGNGSQDNQNTLMLDSQSMIMEAGDGNQTSSHPLMQRDPNLSQQMRSFEASIINQQQQYSNFNNMKGHDQQNPYGQNNMMSGQYFTQNMNVQNNNNNGFQSSSNGTSSIVNTDILTYSLTNTYTTIESLHDELVVIKNGLEQSQKRGANILRTIQKYAKEIEENKLSDEEFEENVQSNEDSFKDDFSQLEDENLNFIKDIKGFHDKIHNEIGQLKNILMDQTKTANSPLSTRKHIMSERVPQKNQPSLLQTPAQLSMLSPEAIENTQCLINEIKKEMSEILGLNCDAIKSQSSNSNFGGSISQAQYESNVSKAQKSVKIIDLLENLQQSLLYSVKPILCMKRNMNTDLKPKNALTTSSQNTNQSLSSTQNFMFSPQKYINNQQKPKKNSVDPLRKSSDQYHQQRSQNSGDYNQQTLKFQDQQKIHKSSIKSNTKMSQYLMSGNIHKQKPDQSNSKQIQYRLEKEDLQNIPNFNKSPTRQQVDLPQFNQIPPILQVSPPQTYSMLTEDEDNHLFDPIQQTPEIFKSLSKFNNNIDNTDKSNHNYQHNYSSRRSDYHNSMIMNQQQNQQVQHLKQSHNEQQQSFMNNSEYGNDTNNKQPFFSKQSQNPNDTYNIILNRINISDISNGNMNMNNMNQQDFQVTLRQNCNMFQSQSEKQDPYSNVGAAIVGNSINISSIMENNTTVNNNNANRRKGVDNTLTLIFDSDEEEQENDAEQNQSVGKVKEIEEFFFNEENSKIERGSSLNRASFQVSNSFQAENQSLFMDNNNIEVSNNYNNFQREQIMNSMKMNSKNRKASHSANSRDNSLLFNSKVPSLDKYAHKSSKVRVQDPTSQDFIQNKMPQIQFSISQPQGASLSSSNQISRKNKLSVGEPILQQINNPQPIQTEEGSGTSKQSVLKYWNQFFNKEQQQTSLQVPLNQNQNQQQSRNNFAMSKSVYQSRTSKDAQNKQEDDTAEGGYEIKLTYAQQNAKNLL